MENIVKIDLYDKKLLYELDKKSNINLNELAKKLRKSKQFILYRMQRLEQVYYGAILSVISIGNKAVKAFQIAPFFCGRARRQPGEIIAQGNINIASLRSTL